MEPPGVLSSLFAFRGNQWKRQTSYSSLAFFSFVHSASATVGSRRVRVAQSCHLLSCIFPFFFFLFLFGCSNQPATAHPKYCCNPNYRFIDVGSKYTLVFHNFLWVTCEFSQCEKVWVTSQSWWVSGVSLMSNTSPVCVTLGPVWMRGEESLKYDGNESVTWSVWRFTFYCNWE